MNHDISNTHFSHSGNKYVNRLAEEWKQHGKIIIGLDFDDTVSPWNINSEKECDKVIQTVKEAQHVGAYIVIFTQCNSDRYDQIREYLYARGLVVDEINRQPIELPYGNQNKIYANIFIDDRAGLQESLEILREAMYKQRAAKYSAVHRDEIG